MVRAAHFTEGDTEKWRGVTPMWGHTAPFQVQRPSVRRIMCTSRLSVGQALRLVTPPQSPADEGIADRCPAPSAVKRRHG